MSSSESNDKHQNDHGTATESDPLLSSPSPPATTRSGSFRRNRRSHGFGGGGGGGGESLEGNNSWNNESPSSSRRRLNSSDGGGGHHRRTSTALDVALDTIFEAAVNVKDAVVEVTDAVVEEIIEVKDILVDELQQAAAADNQGGEDADKYMFLDMGLARNLSILPGDVVDASHTLQQQQQQQPSCRGWTFLPDPVVSAQGEPGTGAVVVPPTEPDQEEADGLAKVQPVTTPPISAYFLLASAIISLSSIGPLLELQDGINAILKVAWRASGTACALFPLAARAVYKEGWPKLSSSHWVMVPITAIMYTTMVVCFSISLNYTAVGNAVILSNSQSLMLLIGKLFMGVHVTPLEASGALVAFSGAVLCSKDSSEAAPSASDDTLFPYRTYIGDAFALCSAIGGAVYIVFAKSVRPHLNLYVFMFANMFQTALYSMMFCYLSGAPITVSRNPTHGTFGWMNRQLDRFPLEVLIVVVCNLLGAMGYVRAMQYFDALVISVSALLEPVVAELMACLLGVGFLPGWKGWLGNALVIGGTFAVVYTPPGGRGKGGSDGGH